MTRIELIERLRSIQNKSEETCASRIGVLIEDIELDGVLDVQAPTEIAAAMKLPRAWQSKNNIHIRGGYTVKRRPGGKYFEAYLLGVRCKDVKRSKDAKIVMDAIDATRNM